MSHNKYSKLQIDTNKMENWISLWCEENLEGEYSITIRETQDRIRYTITNGNKTILLDLQKAAKGLFTIHYKIGTQQVLSSELAQWIYSKVNYVLNASPFSNGFSVKISEEDAKLIIDIIKEDEDIYLEYYNEVTTPGVANYRLYRFKSKKGDSAVIKFYTNTSRLQIQGKPLYVFNKAVSVISEVSDDKDELVDAHIKFCDLGVTKEEVYNELKDILGDRLYAFLPLSHRAMLSTTLNLCKVDFEADDYSYLLTNACRVYEGYVKKVFAQKGLTCEGEQQLGKFFEWDGPTNPVMKSDYSACLDRNVEETFTAMYKAYSRYRHPYMHASGYDVTTAIIGDKESAEDKLNEIIMSLKDWHEQIVNYEL